MAYFRIAQNHTTMKKLCLAILLIIMLFGCKKDPIPPVIVPQPLPGDLNYVDLITMMEHPPQSVFQSAPGGLLGDSVKDGHRYLVYGLLPYNIGMDPNLTMEYNFRNDSLKKILIRDDTCTRALLLAYESSMMAESTISLDSIRHFVKFKFRSKDKLLEFPSADSMWRYILDKEITRDSMEILASIWQDESTYFSITYARDVDMTTGQIKLIE